jgi:predicted acyltransferase
MVVFGVCGIIGGQVLNTWFPINKNLWTSSFVIFAGGFSLLALSFWYWMVEMCGYRGGWTVPILVFGMNPIAGYVADSFVYGPMYSFSVKGSNGGTLRWQQAAESHIVAAVGNIPLASLIYSLAAVLFCWLLLACLYRKRIFIKI